MYTVRYAHMENCHVEIGQMIKRNDVIGMMGSTGKSSAPHLHIDCVEGRVIHPYYQIDIERNRYKAAYRQLLYFVDAELFNCKLIVTAGFADPQYFHDYGIVHMGFDVVPANRHESKDNFKIFWNRSYEGRVISTGYDEDGYGNFVHITFK